MSEFEFTLVLRPSESSLLELEDAVFEAGCDDALLGARDGVPFLDFTREASSLVDAITSAIRDVESTSLGLLVVRVEPDELVNAADIAERTGRTRESIRLLVSGKRGPGGFPAPVRGITNRNRLWRWSAVSQWMADHVKDAVSSEQVEHAAQIAAVNAALQLRNSGSSHTQEILQRLAG